MRALVLEFGHHEADCVEIFARRGDIVGRVAGIVCGCKELIESVPVDFPVFTHGGVAQLVDDFEEFNDELFIRPAIATHIRTAAEMPAIERRELVRAAVMPHQGRYAA